ncbi:MAG: lipid A deacylase LpxR family protein [Rhodospirillaceae bacterium]|nr:lipid A deacylase LpxR family protein [Rhodospirillaceae bacterium]
MDYNYFWGAVAITGLVATPVPAAADAAADPAYSAYIEALQAQTPYYENTPAVATPAPAMPQADDGGPATDRGGEKNQPSGGVWRLEFENEDTGGINIFETPMHEKFSERVESGHLTWGWRVSYTPNAANPDWTKKFRDDLFWPTSKWTARVSYALQQSAYTPNTYNKDKNLLHLDRPAAGYLLGNVRINLEQDFQGNRQYIDQLNLGVGLVGPASGAGVVHRVAHSAVGRESTGWQEIKTEPVVVAQYETGKRWVWGEDWLGFEAYPHAGMTLGNAYTYGAVGGSVRVGSHLKKDSGPLRTAMIMSDTNYPEPGDYYAWNLFAGIEGRAVAYNIFVDGNTYASTSGVDSKPLVADAQLGGEIGWGEYRLSLMHVFRSREFEGQIKADQFIRVGLSASF